MKQPLKHLSIKVTPQTYYHLTQLAAMAGYTNLGKVVDKLVREHQLSMTYREGGDCQCEAHTGRRQRKTRKISTGEQLPEHKEKDLRAT